MNSTQMEKSDTEDDFDALCEEAHRNAREDRKTMAEFLKAITDSEEPAVLLAEAVTRAADALGKANSQIIQLAQLRLKSRQSGPTVHEMEKDAMFDEIGDPHDATVTENN